VVTHDGVIANETEGVRKTLPTENDAVNVERRVEEEA
jgi:hypothetical protein